MLHGLSQLITTYDGAPRIQIHMADERAKDDGMRTHTIRYDPVKI